MNTDITIIINCFLMALITYYVISKTFPKPRR